MVGGFWAVPSWDLDMILPWHVGRKKRTKLKEIESSGKREMGHGHTQQILDGRSGDEHLVMAVCAQICPQPSLQRAHVSGLRVASGSCEQKQRKQKREAFSHYTFSKKPEQTLQQWEQLTTNHGGRHTFLFPLTPWGWDSSVCPGHTLRGGVASVGTAQLTAPRALGSQSLPPGPKRQRWRCRQRSVTAAVPRNGGKKEKRIEYFPA